MSEERQFDTLLACLEEIKKRDGITLKAQDEVVWLIGVKHVIMTPIEAIKLMKEAGIAEKPVILREASTFTMNETFHGVRTGRVITERLPGHIVHRDRTDESKTWFLFDLLEF